MSALKQLLKDHNVNQNTLSKPMCVSVSAVNLFVLGQQVYQQQT